MWQLWLPKERTTQTNYLRVYEETFQHFKLNQCSLRFEESKANIIHFFSLATIGELYPDLLERDGISEGPLLKNLRCLSILLPSILAKMDEFEQAI